MRYPLCSLLIASVAGALGTFAGSAHALSCAAPGLTAPMLNAIDVPTNTLIWCTRLNDNLSLHLRVTDAHGQPVPGTQTLMISAQFRLGVFRPDAELAPQAQYQFQCNDYASAQPISFATGDGPRNESPALPNLSGMTVVANAAGSGWGESLYGVFPNIGQQDTILVLDLEGGPALDPAALTGGLDDADLILPTASATVGRDLCGSNWPGVQLGASTRLRFGAFDLTGAFSGWTDWTTLTLPDRFPGTAKEDEPIPDSAPTTPPVAAPDEALEAPDGNEQTLTGNGAPNHDVVSVDLASDSAATPSRQSRGCQLGTHGGTSWAAGLLAALAIVAARRQRRSMRYCATASGRFPPDPSFSNSRPAASGAPRFVSVSARWRPGPQTKARSGPRNER